MSNQETSESPRGYDLFGQMPFIKLLTSFRSAIQPSRLALALLCVVVLFVVGYIMDYIWWDSANVMTNPKLDYANEIEAAVSGQDVEVYRSDARSYYDTRLTLALMGAPFNEKEDKAREIIAANEAYELIKDEYRKRLPDAAKDLETSYKNRKSDINDDFKDKIDRAARGEEEKLTLMRDKALEDLDASYDNLVNALINGQALAAEMNGWVDKVIVIQPNLTGEDLGKARDSINTKKNNLTAALQLAQAHQLARKACGQGIFEGFYQFKLNRFQVAVKGLLSLDLATVCTAMMDILQGVTWMVREHVIFSVIFFAICLVIISIFGGAICRMAALQFARDERIGPMQALKFSFRKFGSFFTAPLVPLAIIVLICVLLAVGGMVAAIPHVGEIIAGILTGLALFGGFVIALVAIGLVGGFNLMYPAIAVEGSDSFDAISRAFSYLFSRPWRLGFYTLVAWIYGAICYLVVRLFVFITLVAVRGATGLTMNWDSSALIFGRDKMDAIWPTPYYWNLVGDVPWATLGVTETIGAALIFIWVALAAAVVLAFLVSFFYTAHTTIYYLLRQRVDATDLEDVFIEEPMENLLEEAKPAPEAVDTAESAPAKSAGSSERDGEANTDENPEEPKTEG